MNEQTSNEQPVINLLNKKSKNHPFYKATTIYVNRADEKVVRKLLIDRGISLSAWACEKMKEVVVRGAL